MLYNNAVILHDTVMTHDNGFWSHPVIVTIIIIVSWHLQFIVMSALDSSDRS